MLDFFALRIDDFFGTGFALDLGARKTFFAISSNFSAASLPSWYSCLAVTIEPDHNSHHNPDDAASDAPCDTSGWTTGNVIVDEQGKPYKQKENTYEELKHLIGAAFDLIPHGEKLMILLTSIIALSTVGQMVISCNNNVSTGKQVDKLIVAAGRVGTAAEGFSASAVDINQGISNAVIKLGKQADASANSYEGQVRPYVGIQGIAFFQEKDRHPRHLQAYSRNFGSVPAQNFRFEWKAILDGQPVHVRRVPDAPKVLYPTEVANLLAGFTDEQSEGLFRGTKPLVIYLRIHYEWRMYSYDECDKYKYEPVVGAFLDLGPICGAWDKIPVMFLSPQEMKEQEELELKNRQTPQVVSNK